MVVVVVVVMMGRRDGYTNRLYPNRNGRNYGLGRGVDDRDSVVPGIGHVGSGSVRLSAFTPPTRDGYPNGLYPNRNDSNHGAGRGVDDRDGVGVGIGHVGSGSILRDRYPKRI